MFSFHKPKVYRSSTGCCICKAKSSSSRFTDSKKYEDDFLACFQLKDRRSGEICNACVLLVKRWKKLPEGSDRNWGHVVDVRAGPGTKSLTKFKSKNKKLKVKTKNAQTKEKSIIKKKHMYIKSDLIMRDASPGALSDDITGEDFLSDISGPSMPTSLAPSPVSFEVAATKKSKLHVSASARSNIQLPTVSNFVDMTYWKIENVCCGTIFRGRYGELMLDPELFKPCSTCNRQKSQIQAPAPVTELEATEVEKNKEPGSQSTNLAKNYSDSSSDSGYDESSNPGVVDGSVRSGTNPITNNPLADFAMHASNRCLQLPAPAN